MPETRKNREELAIVVTYFSNDPKQTHGYRRVSKTLECNGGLELPVL